MEQSWHFWKAAFGLNCTDASRMKMLSESELVNSWYVLVFIHKRLEHLEAHVFLQKVPRD